MLSCFWKVMYFSGGKQPFKHYFTGQNQILTREALPGAVSKQNKCIINAQ